MSRPGYVDKRGSHSDRKRRRAWLLAEFDPDLGHLKARCHLRLSVMCERVVDGNTLSVDRIIPGGTYARHNIRPACKPCQDRQGGLSAARSMSELIGSFRDARDAWEARFEAATNMTYRPGIIERERRKSARGGRNEVTDFVEQDPPPLFRDWLVEWSAFRRESSEDRAGATNSA